MFACLVTFTGCQAFLSFGDEEPRPQSDASTTSVVDAGDSSTVTDRDGGQVPSGIFVRGKSQLPYGAGDRITLQKPSGTAVGDLLLAFIDTTGIELAPAPPAEFAERGRLKAQGPTTCGNGGGTHVFLIFTHRAGVDEPTQYLFVMGTGAAPFVSGAIVAVAGVDKQNPFDGELDLYQQSGGDAGAANLIRYSPPSVNVTAGNAYVLYFLGDMGGGYWTMLDRATSSTVGDEIVNNTFIAIFGEKALGLGPAPARDFTVAVPGCPSNGAIKILALRPQ